MKTIFNKKTVRFTAVLVIGASLSFYSGMASEKGSASETDSSVVVIVNSENEIHDLSSIDLKRIYLGELDHWGNGEIIQKTSHKAGSRIQEVWLSSVLNITERKFQHIWLKNIFTGKASPPKSFISAKKVIAFVSENSEAIGFVSEAESLPSSVKTITIDGSNQLKKEDN